MRSRSTRSILRSGRHLVAAVLGLAAIGGSVLADEVPAGPPVATSLLSLHSDFKLALMSAPRKADEPGRDGLLAQAGRVVAALAGAGKSLYPDAMARIGKFDVFIADSRDVEARSSASGRIALNAGIGDLKPTDDWLALVLAREMGHVIAGHHADNSAASIVTSVLMNLLVPGSGLVKSALSFAGSQIAESSGQSRQIAEADEIAYKLLGAAGFTPATVALSVTLGPSAAQLGASAWARGFAQSAQDFLARVRGRGEALRFAEVPAQPARDASVAAPASVPAVVASTESHLRHPVPARLQAEDIVVRTRPSGMPGPLMLGGYLVPARRIE